VRVDAIGQLRRERAEQLGGLRALGVVEGEERWNRGRRIKEGERAQRAVARAQPKPTRARPKEWIEIAELVDVDLGAAP
jgi:hypothetical protein